LYWIRDYLSNLILRAPLSSGRSNGRGSPIPVPETPSVFHPLAQGSCRRNARSDGSVTFAMLPAAQMSVYIIAMSLLIVAHYFLLRAIDSLGGSAARWNRRLRHSANSNRL
jgi:hypothetical protein